MCRARAASKMQEAIRKETSTQAVAGSSTCEPVGEFFVTGEAFKKPSKVS